MTIKKFASSAVIILTAVLSVIVHRVQAQEGPRRLKIVATRYEFTPGDITVKKGVPVTVVLTSKDFDHGLTFPQLRVGVVAQKGETKEVTFTPRKTGTFLGECSVFCGSGHGQMNMTLHVTD